jgi:protein-S-isoprenylcysteine O-methyltransferase Ste14
MKASAIEFRLRMGINLTIVLLGFLAPWTWWLDRGWRLPLLEWLPLELSRIGAFTFAVATPVVIAAGALVAAIGAILRVWGTASLGPATVQHGQMQAGMVMADGPYRYVRNPLYLGLWCTIAALGLLMPPSGDFLTMVLLTVFLLRLILCEEAFLAAKLGTPYHAYLQAVPRLVPRMRTTLPHTGRRPQWLRGVLAEISPIGVFIALAFLSWSYDNRLAARTIVVSFGISLVIRAFLPAVRQEPDSPE